MRELITLHVNGESQELAVLPQRTLLEVLREDMGLIGTKHGCELGECGACTILLDGVPVLACLTLPLEVQESEITTIEGLEQHGKLHPLQETFAELGAAQCGYCTPGMLLSGAALLRAHPRPTRAEASDVSPRAKEHCHATGRKPMAGVLRAQSLLDLACVVHEHRPGRGQNCSLMGGLYPSGRRRRCQVFVHGVRGAGGQGEGRLIS